MAASEFRVLKRIAKYARNSENRNPRETHRKTGGAVVALHVLKPQVRGFVLELGKVNSAFHHFSGSIKRRTKYAWELDTVGSALD